MNAAFAARSSDFPSLAREFVKAYDVEVQSANMRLEKVELMLRERRYDEADSLLLDEPPLLELCDGLRQIEADKQGVLKGCKISLKRVVDAKRLERVMSASAAQAQRKTTATPPPLPPSARAAIGRNPNAGPDFQSQKYLVPSSIGIGAFGVLCLIISLVMFSLRSTSNPAVLASLAPPSSSFPRIDLGETRQKTSELSETAVGEVSQDAMQANAPSEAKSEIAPLAPVDSTFDELQGKAIDSEVVLPTDSALVGVIQAAKLLKGDVCVRLEIEDFTDIPPKEARYSYKNDGLAYNFAGAFTSQNRPPHIKHLECSITPLKLIVDIELKDVELTEHAIRIKNAWGSLSKAVAEWQSILRKSGLPRPQVLELLIEKPVEPKSSASVPVFREQLAELTENIGRVVARLNEYQDDRANRAHLQAYSSGLKTVQDLIASLQQELNSLTNTDREFETGTIMYVGRVEGGKLVDATELRTMFILGPAN